MFQLSHFLMFRLKASSETELRGLDDNTDPSSYSVISWFDCILFSVSLCVFPKGGLLDGRVRWGQRVAELIQQTFSSSKYHRVVLVPRPVSTRETISFPGSLILPPQGASEERPWHTLVTCLPKFGRWQLICWRDGWPSRYFAVLNLREFRMCCDQNKPRPRWCSYSANAKENSSITWQQKCKSL